MSEVKLVGPVALVQAPNLESAFEALQETYALKDFSFLLAEQGFYKFLVTGEPKPQPKPTIDLVEAVLNALLDGQQQGHFVDNYLLQVSPEGMVSRPRYFSDNEDRTNYNLWKRMVANKKSISLENLTDFFAQNGYTVELGDSVKGPGRSATYKYLNITELEDKGTVKEEKTELIHLEDLPPQPQEQEQVVEEPKKKGFLGFLKGLFKKSN